MIEIYSENHGKAVFESYDDLFAHICKEEKKRSLETGIWGWDFTIYSHEELKKFYINAARAMEILFTEKEQEAYENNLELLEIYNGNPDEPNQIVLTSDVNVDDLMEDWCRDYYLSKGYKICERG